MAASCIAEGTASQRESACVAEAVFLQQLEAQSCGCVMLPSVYGLCSSCWSLTHLFLP